MTPTPPGQGIRPAAAAYVVEPKPFTKRAKPVAQIFNLSVSPGKVANRDDFPHRPARGRPRPLWTRDLVLGWDFAGALAVPGSKAGGPPARLWLRLRKHAVVLERIASSRWFPAVSTVQEIESAAEQLAPEDFAKLATWINRRQAETWDRQIEADAQAGRLDKFIDEALEDLRAGRTTPAP